MTRAKVGFKKTDLPGVGHMRSYFNSKIDITWMQMVLGQARPELDPRNPGRQHQGVSAPATDKPPGEQKEHIIETQGPRRCWLLPGLATQHRDIARNWDSEAGGHSLTGLLRAKLLVEKKRNHPFLRSFM